MILIGFYSLFPGLLAVAAEPAEAPAVRRVVIANEVIFRIPIRPHFSQTVEWVEHKGPKCVDAERIVGAMLSGPSSIDFIMRGRSRLRAKMDSECPALDFYGGFYLRPSDERICAKRETIQSRVGGSCRIERFKTLEPRLRR